MKLYWIVVWIVIGCLLIKLGIDTGLWIAGALGLLVSLSALSEFFQRLSRAVCAMKGMDGC
ncbi:MAG: hypothetical protein K9K37_07895 [Desulfocapsa sp.]|nr:hypothetical protein [Desulfocapsa sp.]